VHPEIDIIISATTEQLQTFMSEKILLVYQSSRGSTQQAAEWIAAELPDVKLINLAREKPPEDLEVYNTIIVGSGIFAGRAYKKVRLFVDKNRELLLRKDLCLFITHLEEDEGIELDFQSAFDEELLEHARHRQGVGGRLNINKVNILFRPMVHMIAREKNIDMKNHDTLSQEACKEFAAKVLNV
jgi:menaquinone-dependent protoporphyrinogen oxidase